MTPNLADPLSESEIDELDQFLMSDATSDETLTIDVLDGYFTAIVIGPTTVMPSRWMAGVWGPTPDHAPEYESIGQAQRIMELLMRHMNGIVGTFEHDAQSFEPMFNLVKYGGNGREYLDGEGWAMGFMQAIELTRQDWRPLLANPEMVKVLQPIHLLGAADVTADEESLVTTPAQREKWTQKIPDALVTIHDFWLPYRRAVHQRHTAPSVRRVNPTIGRNDPCPCGSGKKFKKCCARQPRYIDLAPANGSGDSQGQIQRQSACIRFPKPVGAIELYSFVMKRIHQ